MDDQPGFVGWKEYATSPPDKQRIMAAVEAEVKEILNLGLTGDELIEAVADGMSSLATQMMMKTFTYHLAGYLSELPEAERRPRALQVLAQISALGGAGSTPERHGMEPLLVHRDVRTERRASILGAPSPQPVGP